MTVTVSLYNHTVNRFVNGLNAAGDTYRINLYSAFTFNAAATTKAAAESGATQLATANGYTQNDKPLSGVVVELVTTNDARFDASDVYWIASGGNIGPARYALVYNDTDTDDPPVLALDFGANQTAGNGTVFKIVWATSGLVTFTTT